MRPNAYPGIGVMGGMGPDASVAFYRRIIQLFQTEKQTRYNFQYPEMLVHNIPSPDNVEAGVDDELLPYLLNSLKVLEAAGMELIAIPCNSAHVHIDAVREAATAQVMSILEETAKAVGAAGIDTVLVLGTASTLKYNLYPPALEERGVRALIPSELHQQVITDAIMAVCDGSLGPATRAAVLEVIASYPQAQGVILGCTEIPLIVGQQDMDITCFDTAEILARATFERCIG